MITPRSFDLTKTRQEWLVLLSKIHPSPFLKDASPSFRDQLFSHVGHLDTDWIVFSEIKNDLGASPIVYIDEDGIIRPLGCRHCIAGHRDYDGQTLMIAAKKAVPFSKKSTALDEFSFIFDKILFFCPYCNKLIKDYAGDFII